MSYYNQLHDGDIPGTEEEGDKVEALSGHEGTGGIQKHSCGDLYPWVHTYVENQTEGWGKHYYIHPDGRETLHRQFRLGDKIKRGGAMKSWNSIMYGIAEEDAREAIKRDKAKADAQPKRPVVRTCGKLNNGADIIAQVGVVVLAKRANGIGFEYATWTVDAELNASSGHYFPGNGKGAQPLDLTAAMIDFVDRVGAWYPDLQGGVK